MKHTACALTLFIGIAMMPGCGNPGRPRIEPMTPAELNYNASWEASKQVLRDYGFRLDRQDRRAGVITTFRETSKSFFECWRKDTATAYDTLESSLQTIYRAASVQIEPIEGTDLFTATVRVAVSRSNQPSLQLTDTSEALDLFQLSVRRRTRLLLDYGLNVDANPVPLPDDEVLAEKIRRDIEARTGRLSQQLHRQQQTLVVQR